MAAASDVCWNWLYGDFCGSGSLGLDRVELLDRLPGRDGGQDEN